jgi:hypothetical protein
MLYCGAKGTMTPENRLQPATLRHWSGYCGCPNAVIRLLRQFGREATACVRQILVTPTSRHDIDLECN